MNLLKVLSVATAGLLPVLGLAQFTVSFSATQDLPNDTTTNLYLSKFDPAKYGALTGVNLSIGVNILGANVQFDNDSPNAQVGTGRVLTVINNFGSSLGGFSLLNASGSPVADSMQLQINIAQDFDLDPTSGDTVGAFNPTVLDDYASWNPGTLSSQSKGDIASLFTSLYEGTGDFNLFLNATYVTSATFSGDDGYFKGNTPNGQYTATVTYTYIPEPSTYALILGALTLGLVGWRRFRK